MDPRLQITDEPRRVAAGLTAETPLVAIAWRALRGEHQRRSEERRQTQSEMKVALNALAGLANEAYRLQRTVQSIYLQDGEGQQLSAIASRMVEILAGAGIRIVAPEGEPYSSDLRELLDNVAQQSEAGLVEARIAQVITPAVLRNDAVLKMGKAVIAVPSSNAPQQVETTTETSQ